MSSDVFMLLSALAGAIVGGAIAYVTTSLQMARELEEKRKDDRVRKVERMVVLVYDLSEYFRRCAVIKNFAPAQIAHVGPCPDKEIRAVATLYFPDMADAVGQLEDVIIDVLSGSTKISEDKYKRAIRACNAFGELFLERHVKNVTTSKSAGK